MPRELRKSFGVYNGATERCFVSAYRNERKNGKGWDFRVAVRFQWRASYRDEWKEAKSIPELIAASLPTYLQMAQGWIQEQRLVDKQEQDLKRMSREELKNVRSIEGFKEAVAACG